MRFVSISPKKNALLYAAKIVGGALILWFGLRALGFAQPYWAIISLITVTEPDITLAKQNFSARMINTTTGSVTALLALFALGPGLPALLAATLASVLIAMFVQQYPENWRLAPVTAVVIMSAAVTGGGLRAELNYALLRVVEVLVGSVLALLQSYVYGALIERWIGRPVRRPPAI